MLILYELRYSEILYQSKIIRINSLEKNKKTKNLWIFIENKILNKESHLICFSQYKLGYAVVINNPETPKT